jgi:hypothetical protein
MESKWDIIRESDVNRQLPAATPLEANILGVPLAAPSTKSAYRLNQLEHSWVSNGEPATFTLLRPTDRPLPTIKHCVVLDALLCRFAFNFNQKGELKFRLSDIARDLHKKNESSNLDVIKEAIDRYFTCTAIWVGSFNIKGVMERGGWSGTIIQYSSFRDPRVSSESLRNAKDPDAWHRIEFHPMIVKSLREKNVRLIATDSLTLPCPQYQLYRWLRSWDDRRLIRCSLKVAQRILHIERGGPGFKRLMEGRLSGLKEAGYLLDYKVFATYFEAKLTPFDTLKQRNKNNPDLDWDAMGDRDNFDFDFPTIELTSQEVDESGRIKN